MLLARPKLAVALGALAPRLARLGRWGRVRGAVVVGLALAWAGASRGATEEFVGYARGVFDHTLAQWQKAATDPAAACEFGRACFEYAEFATNHTQRAALAEQGVAACQQVVARASNSPAVHYYLALNLAQLARTKSLGALKMVARMEKEFETARKLGETIDFAGPDRYLGMLYRDAPAIVSIGDRVRAEKHLERAVALAPEFPANQLALVESYLKWGERGHARRQLATLAALRPAARATLAGPAWAAHWAEWDTDYARFEKQAIDPAKALQPIKDR